jgi:DNA-binding transcriptional ArsR family regulator
MPICCSDAEAGAVCLAGAIGPIHLTYLGLVTLAAVVPIQPIIGCVLGRGSPRYPARMAPKRRPGQQANIDLTLYTLYVIFILVDVFTAVAEPSRRQLLDLLADGERPAGDLVAALPRLTQPAVSRHLRVLRDAGLVSVRPDAQRRVYALRAERLAEIDAWLAPYRRYWARHLDALERHLDKE